MDVLYEALTLMTTEDGPFLMKRNYPEFYAILLHFLQKKPVDVINDAEVYACGGVRPLNITNVDNRLVASAVKLAIGPLLNKLVTWDQFFDWQKHVVQHFRCGGVYGYGGYGEFASSRSFVRCCCYFSLH